MWSSRKGVEVSGMTMRARYLSLGLVLFTCCVAHGLRKRCTPTGRPLLRSYFDQGQEYSVFTSQTTEPALTTLQDSTVYGVNFTFSTDTDGACELDHVFVMYKGECDVTIMFTTPANNSHSATRMSRRVHTDFSSSLRSLAIAIGSGFWSTRGVRVVASRKPTSNISCNLPVNTYSGNEPFVTLIITALQITTTFATASEDSSSEQQGSSTSLTLPVAASLSGVIVCLLLFIASRAIWRRRRRSKDPKPLVATDVHAYKVSSVISSRTKHILSKAPSANSSRSPSSRQSVQKNKIDLSEQLDGRDDR